MPAVGPLVRPELLFTDLVGADCQAILRALADRTAATGLVDDAGGLFRALLEREQLGSTGIGHKTAIPHCKLKGLDQGVVAVGIARQGVDFGAPDGQPVAIFFLVLSPADSPAEHLQILARVSRWVRTDGNVDTLLSLADRAAVLDFVRETL
jgi:PTS system nitrogen regulatory IIA component